MRLVVVAAVAADIASWVLVAMAGYESRLRWRLVLGNASTCRGSRVLEQVQVCVRGTSAAVGVRVGVRVRVRVVVAVRTVLAPAVRVRPVLGQFWVVGVAVLALLLADAVAVIAMRTVLTRQRLVAAVVAEPMPVAAGVVVVVVVIIAMR
jgi:hypothetical protein